MWSRLFSCCRGKPKKDQARAFDIESSSPEQATLLAKPARASSSSSCLQNLLLILSMIGESVTLPLSATEIADGYELFGGQKNEWLGYSKEAVITACTLSVYFLISSIYLHYALQKNTLEKDDASEDAINELPWLQKIKNISGLQLFAVTGHLLDHTFAAAAAMVFAIEKITTHAQTPLAHNIKILVQGLAIATGMLFSLADTGVDINTLNVRNERQRRNG